MHYSKIAKNLKVFDMDVRKLDIGIDYEKLLAEFNEKNWEQTLIDMHDNTNGNVVNQMSLQKTIDCPIEDELVDSCGSLFFDWSTHDPKNGTSGPKMRDVVRKEDEFNVLCSEFDGTYMSEVIELLKEKYNVVRGRMMALDWKTCLTIHKDKTQRIHIPLVTDKDCFMLIDDVPHRLEFGATYLTNTTKFHTAVNASKIYRTHLVFCTDMFNEKKERPKSLPWDDL